MSTPSSGTRFLMKGVLIGFGNMGQTHWERYRQLQVELKGVVEIDPAKIELVKAKGLPVYSSLSKIPKPTPIDFIDICTPTHLHFQQIQEAMRFEKPIFVEKPVVRLPEELQKLRKLNYPYPIFVGEVEHYNPKLKSFLDYAGIPQNISIRREVNLAFFLSGASPWFLDEKLSGGIILDTMIHDINLLVGKYGKPTVKRVEKRACKYDQTDEVEVDLDFQGFSAQLYASWAAPERDSPITTQIQFQKENGETVEILCDDYLIRRVSPESDGYYLELKAFLKGVQSNRSPYPLPFYLDALEVAFEIRDR